MPPALARPGRLPAEWEAQAGTLLIWPHEASDWASDPTGDVAVAEHSFLTLGLAIASRQTLLSVCGSEPHRRAIEQRLCGAGADPARLRFAVEATDDTWARDIVPLTRVDPDQGVTLLDFRFNGWGGKYPATHDDRLGAALHARGVFGSAARHRSELVVEGGALETDGQGTLLAVRRTLIDPARNPGIDDRQLANDLLSLTGADRLLMLDSGALTGDDTDGHIDTLARFVDPATIVHVSAGRADPDHATLAAMRDELAALRRTDGTPYRLVALPSPGIITDAGGRRLPASYANYQLINDAILIPVYDTPRDAEAVRILGALHPGRATIPIDARHILTQNGGLHCLCMQFPRGVELRSA